MRLALAFNGLVVHWSDREGARVPQGYRIEKAPRSEKIFAFYHLADSRCP